MTFRPRQPATSDRLAETIGPEVLAAGLSAVILVVLVGFTLFGRVSPQAAVEPTSNPSASAPAAASPPASAAVITSPSPVTDPSPTPAASPTVTLPPTQGALGPDAGILIQTERRLIEIRDRLVAATGADPRPTREIADELRGLNTTLTFALTAITNLEREGAPADLTADLRDVHQAAFDASLETLGASNQNAQAYRQGGREVAGILAGLEVLITRIETAAGLPSADPS